jgi:hypothetical protein
MWHADTIICMAMPVVKPMVKRIKVENKLDTGIVVTASAYIAWHHGTTAFFKALLFGTCVPFMWMGLTLLRSLDTCY